MKILSNDHPTGWRSIVFSVQIIEPSIFTEKKDINKKRQKKIRITGTHASTAKSQPQSLEMKSGNFTILPEIHSPAQKNSVQLRKRVTLKLNQM